MKRLKVIYASPNLNDAVSFYRLAGCVEDLRKNYDIDCMTVGEVNWSILRQADILWYNRPFRSQDYMILRIAKYAGIPVVTDYDDYLFGIHEDNPATQTYGKEEIQDAILSCMRISDMVMASTDFLGKLLQQHTEAKIRVVQNAAPYFWNMEGAKEHNPDSKNILYRGSHSHISDFAPYLDSVIEAINKHDYTWYFMGYMPERIYEECPKEKVRYVGWQAIANFYRIFREISPKFTIFPLIDTEFNRSKSNIIQLESAFSGAACLAPDLPEFVMNNSINYKTGDVSDFENKLHKMLTEDLWDDVYWIQQEINKSRTITHANKLRAEYFREAVELKLNPIKDWDAHISRDVEPKGDKDFHETNVKEGNLQDNPHYVRMHYDFADAIIKNFKPESVLDAGCSTGTIVERLQERGIDAHGVDANKYAIKYAKDRGIKNVIKGDITKLKIDRHYDVITSIEVLEHIDHQGVVSFLQAVKGKCNWFIFSSTPNLTNPIFDKKWGHKNIKAMNDWVELFRAFDFYPVDPKLYEGIQITSWTIVFRYDGEIDREKV